MTLAAAFTLTLVFGTVAFGAGYLIGRTNGGL